MRSEWVSGLYSVVGARSSSFENIFAARDVYSKESNVITPYAGLSYNLTPDTTLYTSYAQIYAAQSYSYSEDGKPIDPVEGDTYEAGVKTSWLNGRLNGSAAWYQIQRQNLAVQVSTDSSKLYCCYVAAAEVESRGLDTELTGQLLPGWELSVGYTFNLNEYKAGFDSRNGTTYSPRTPKHLLKLWTMAQLPQAPDWRVGGGVNWQSKNYATGTAATYNATTNEYNGPSVPFQYEQEAYAVVGLRGEYRVNSVWSAALNINNLFDKTYYQTVSTSNGGNYYGEPRNAALSLRGQW